MANEILENQSLPPAEAPQIAANLDAELDNALSNAFPSHQPIEPKPNEKVVEKSEPKPAIKENPTEAKAVAKPTEEAKPKIEDKTELPDPDQIDANPPKKSGTQSKEEGWNALKNNYRKAVNLKKEGDEEIKKLKASLAEKGNFSQKETEALKSQIQELSKYRAMVDIQADPEFISKYDQPIEKNIGSIKEMLLSLDVNKDIVDQIDFTNTKLMDDIIGHVGEHRDKFVARKLQRKVEELVDLTDKRGESLEEQKKNYKELLESKKKESFSRSAEDEGRLYKHLESIAATKDQAGNAVFPFLSKLEPKEGADQAEINRAANHNHLVDLMQQKIQTVIKMTSPEQKAEVAVAAVAAHYLTAQLKKVTSELNAVKSELEKISNVNSDTEKVKSPTRRNSPEKIVNLDDAMAAHFGR